MNIGLLHFVCSQENCGSLGKFSPAKMKLNQGRKEIEDGSTQAVIWCAVRRAFLHSVVPVLLGMCSTFSAAVVPMPHQKTASTHEHKSFDSCHLSSTVERAPFLDDLTCTESKVKQRNMRALLPKPPIAQNYDCSPFDPLQLEPIKTDQFPGKADAYVAKHDEDDVRRDAFTHVPREKWSHGNGGKTGCSMGQSQRRRPPMACVPCRKKKSRCEYDLQRAECTSCARANKECKYERTGRQQKHLLVHRSKTAAVSGDGLFKLQALNPYQTQRPEDQPNSGVEWPYSRSNETVVQSCSPFAQSYSPVVRPSFVGQDLPSQHSLWDGHTPHAHYGIEWPDETDTSFPSQSHPIIQDATPFDQGLYNRQASSAANFGTPSTEYEHRVISNQCFAGLERLAPMEYPFPPVQRGAVLPLQGFWLFLRQPYERS